MPTPTEPTAASSCPACREPSNPDLCPDECWCDCHKASAASIYESRDGQLTVTGTRDTMQVAVGSPHDFRVADLTPEEVAHLSHALNQWIARFTNNA